MLISLADCTAADKFVVGTKVLHGVAGRLADDLATRHSRTELDPDAGHILNSILEELAFHIPSERHRVVEMQAHAISSDDIVLEEETAYQAKIPRSCAPYEILVLSTAAR